MPNIRWLISLITRLHRGLYLATDGRIGGSSLGWMFLLLHHRGRRSGRDYVTPLLCVEHGDGYVVAASNGGDARPPSWWLNLSAQPRTRVQQGRRKLEVVARVVEGQEREKLWERLQASYASFDRYAATAGREIPVVALEPVAPGADAADAGATSAG